jgi:hypothetical protein
MSFKIEDVAKTATDVQDKEDGSKLRASSILDALVRRSNIEEDVEVEHAGNMPSPHNQLGAILLLTFLYFVQGVTLNIPKTLGVFMAHEVQGCKNRYYVQTYLDNVFWPFTIKVFFAPVIDFIPLCCFNKKHH